MTSEDFNGQRKELPWRKPKRILGEARKEKNFPIVDDEGNIKGLITIRTLKANPSVPIRQKDIRAGCYTQLR